MKARLKRPSDLSLSQAPPPATSPTQSTSPSRQPPSPTVLPPQLQIPLSLTLLRNLLSALTYHALCEKHHIYMKKLPNGGRTIHWGQRQILLTPIEELGRGQFGNVTGYKVSEGYQDFPIAIKHMAYESAKDKYSETTKHIAISKQLTHSRWLVPTLGQLPGEDALVLPYYAGGSLNDWQSKHHDMPIERKLTIYSQMIYQLASALYDLHNSPQAWIHKDLKPHNVFIDSQHHAFLGDLGSVQTHEEIKANSALGNGTFHLNAPDVFEPSVSYEDPNNAFKLDMWALGLLIKEMLDCPTPNQAIIQQCKEDSLSKVDRHTLFKEWAQNYPTQYLTYLQIQNTTFKHYPDQWQTLNALANCLLSPADWRPLTKDILNPSIHWAKRLTDIQTAIKKQEQRESLVAGPGANSCALMFRGPRPADSAMITPSFVH